MIGTQLLRDLRSSKRLQGRSDENSLVIMEKHSGNDLMIAGISSGPVISGVWRDNERDLRKRTIQKFTRVRR